MPHHTWCPLVQSVLAAPLRAVTVQQAHATAFRDQSKAVLQAQPPREDAGEWPGPIGQTPLVGFCQSRTSILL